jgi:hypothetical protein
MTNDQHCIKKKNIQSDSDNASYSGLFMPLIFITGLVMGIIIFSSSADTYDKNQSTLVIGLMALFWLEIFTWFIFQIYDFRARKLRKLSTGSIAFIVLILMLLSNAGGYVSMVSITILSCMLLLKMFRLLKDFISNFK